ncbi:prephenate dehydrogenase [Anaerotruncus colihominis]|uniref:Prephenate dehydrogenase n=2 Tax=Anaerotruncus colihominis TaxID=169435 RepID=A0A845SQP5_9FIRM|nr:prephenate dehydrogenase [Anaerotruncus colihominis]
MITCDIINRHSPASFGNGLPLEEIQMEKIHLDGISCVGVAGLGLIGGSMARALKTYTECTVCGCDTDPAATNAALEQGAADRCAEDASVFSDSDVVFVALYPQQAIDFVQKNVTYFKPGCIIADLCGVKRRTVHALSGFCAAHGLVFIGGHPMAGKETWGFSGSDADLFRGASMILTPDAHTPADARLCLECLFHAVGFARVTITTPEAHDSMIAFTSQLAHVVSSAYIKSPRAQMHSGFSAGSYKDLTRVAKLNPRMWTELFLDNADDLCCEIDTIISHLQEFKTAVAAHDGETLYRLLDEGRAIKEALDR